MTAVPHDGTRRGLLRTGGGARLIRPSVVNRARNSAQEGSDSKVARSSAARSLNGGALASGALASGALASTVASVPSLSGLISGKPIRLVLAGRRIRLGSSAFILMVLLALSGILMSLLLLNTALTQDSFRLQDLRTQANDLMLKERQLSAQVAAAQSPVGLEQLAKNLGMVASGDPVFLRLTDGVLLGRGTPGVAPPQPAELKEKGDLGVIDPNAPALVPGAAIELGAAVEPGGEVAVPIDPVMATDANVPTYLKAPDVADDATPGIPVNPGGIFEPGGEVPMGIVPARIVPAGGR